MELCDSDLLIYLNNRKDPFTVEEVRETFLELNNVFKIMHKNNIVHRDLKLGNILIKYDKNSKLKFIPKLSDYGFSKSMGSSDVTETHLGTPATMAPEIMMNLPYDDKSDLWSIGIMMYQLHFKQIPYSGFDEQAILANIRLKARKQPDDPDFKDLLNKLLVMDPKKRISWDQYFNHPFFSKNDESEKNKKEKGLYTKIADFDYGFNFDKNLYECFIAKDNNTNKKVLIRSISNELIDKNPQLFGDEIALFKNFEGNKNILKLINICKEMDKTFLVFEFIECQSLTNYIKNREIKEEEIKKFNKTLYENVFVFNDLSFLHFGLISLHSFVIDKNGDPIIFDFGLNKIFLTKEEKASYYLPNESEMEHSKKKNKTNVMNYGIVLLKLFCGNNLGIEGKEIVLPKDKVLSKDFNNFLSKCLHRNIKKRASWMELGSEDFMLNENDDFSVFVKNKPLIDNEKLKIIFDSLREKFDLITNYYSNLKLNKNTEYIEQIEIFVFITLFEMRIINNLFNRTKNKPFTKNEEITFLSINDNSEMKNCNLNFVNPLLNDTKIIDLDNNELITTFVSDLKKAMGIMQSLTGKILRKTNKKMGSLSEFLKNLVKNFDNSKMQEYFFSINKKAEENKSAEEAYKEYCIAEYLCEFIFFVKIMLYDRENTIPFNKKELVKQFYDIFGDDNNKFEVSVLKLNQTKKNYVLVSFLAIIFKCYKNDIINEEKLAKDKLIINGLVRYYPNLMEKIVELKNRKK